MDENRAGTHIDTLQIEMTRVQNDWIDALREPLGYLRSTKLAALRVDWDFAQAFRALLRRGIRWRFLVRPCNQRIHRQHDKKVHSRGDDKERNKSVDKFAIQKFAAMNREYQPGEVGLLHDRRDKRRQQVLHKTLYHGPERGSDHNSDRHIHDVAPQ